MIILKIHKNNIHSNTYMCFSVGWWRGLSLFEWRVEMEWYDWSDINMWIIYCGEEEVSTGPASTLTHILIFYKMSMFVREV